VTHKRDAGGTVLFTGFPGFIGARLLPRLAELRPGVHFACLVQERFLELARKQLHEIERHRKELKGRFGIVTGDITASGLGLEPGEARALRKDLVGAYHLAAVYDLAVARDVGMRINVQGTKHVLEFLSDARRLEKLDYVSTAYVSGTVKGIYRESDLDVGQGFKNHYEETKFLAEVEVAKSGVPSAVYRPGVVVGDSRTGETAKFDGPYFVLRAMERLPSPGVFLRVGLGGHPVNLVPVDYVIEALAWLSASPASLGKTYHLTDPNPLTALEVAELFARILGKHFLFVPLPLLAAKAALAAPAVQRLLGMPVQALEYFDNPCRYDATEAQKALAAHDLSCPRFPDYAETLVAFYRKQRDLVRRSAMI
jgi:thioester reductase-like protein